jgi:sortase A
MVLSGHISSPGEGAVFHRLPELKTGEGIIVRTDERQYLYRVTEVKTVGPREVSVMAQTTDPVVTLITCFPDGIYSHRLIVTGTLVS